MKKFVFEQEILVRWGDMDSFGHVNNSVYLTYFEQARVLWWQEMQWLPKEMNFGPVIVTARAAFIKPVVYPDTLQAKLYVHSVGRSSYIIDYELYSKDKGAGLMTEGETKVVWIDYKKQKSAPLPPSMKDFLLQA